MTFLVLQFIPWGLIFPFVASWCRPIFELSINTYHWNFIFQWSNDLIGIEAKVQPLKIFLFFLSPMIRIIFIPLYAFKHLLLQDLLFWYWGLHGSEHSLLLYFKDPFCLIVWVQFLLWGYQFADSIYFICLYYF